MSLGGRPEANAADVKKMAETARLPLSDERAAALAPVVSQIQALLDSLDGVSLGETPPSFAFKCRWSED